MSRFLEGDRVEILGVPFGPSMHGEYLEPTKSGHLVRLDEDFCGYLAGGYTYVTVIAVHDDNIILEEIEP